MPSCLCAVSAQTRSQTVLRPLRRPAPQRCACVAHHPAPSTQWKPLSTPGCLRSCPAHRHQQWSDRGAHRDIGECNPLAEDFVVLSVVHFTETELVKSNELCAGQTQETSIPRWPYLVPPESVRIEHTHRDTPSLDLTLIRPRRHWLAAASAAAELTGSILGNSK